MDRETRLAWLVDHYRRPRHKGALVDADAHVPGGNPGCGDVITMYLKGGGTGDGGGVEASRIAAVGWEGVGCTLSQAAASILAERVNREHTSFEEILNFTPEAWIDLLGRDIAEARPQCALLALGTLKAAVKTVEMNRKLRAAGHSDEEIAELRREIARQGEAAGV
ncbi:MAG TPA: iron-sulfur cluster assembly scaffold protein, partial [Gemmatimonadales bacterium]|nr:iron-sulfur cluster assembly scaffold protein [Gemmatimonadales bacterium]